MGLNITCQRCGKPIAIPDETLEEAKSLGVPINAVHEECDETIKEEPLRKFRVVVSIFEDHGDEEELLAKFGGSYEGRNFDESLPKLMDELNKGWTQVQGMSKVIDNP